MKNSFRLAVVLCYLAVGFILIGASGCPLISQAGVGTTINGKITDENGKPVANAAVSTTPTTEIAKTDEAGNYTINEVEAGTYTIKVSKVGYTTKKEEIKISEPTIFSCVVGRTKKIDLILSAELDETGKPKAKTGGMEGTITDAETGKGIQGGTVTTEPATQTITTDTNGKYVIDEVTSGTYTVKVTKDGYIDNSSTGNEVKAGEVKTVDIKLTQTSNAGSIKGKVTNSGGTAIEGVTITTNPPTSTKTTDASGNYEITNVSVGDYTITAVKTGYDTGTKSVTVKKSEQANGDMSLSVIVTTDNFIFVSGGTFTQSDGTNSFSHTISSFYIGKYEVTYDLWYTVYQWAITNGYYFANAGREGNGGTIGSAPTSAKNEPVTTICWRDMIVWCNAYSQKTDKTSIYYSDVGFTTAIKDSRDGSYGSTINSSAGSYDNPYVNWSANGYRLPTEGEWEYAARYKDGTNWTPYNYASGAIADYTNATAIGDVAWYSGNSGNVTHYVGGKIANALGIYDMNGNVWEWCWDWYGNYPGISTDYKGTSNGSYRLIRGGACDNDATAQYVGRRDYYYPYFEHYVHGFRLARSQ